MANLNRGYATVAEIEEMMGKKGLSVVYAKNADNPQKDGDYPFNEKISHPVTGEILHPVRGYCSAGTAFSRPCYYAEYEGKSGTYYYIDEIEYIGPKSDPKSIRAQIQGDRIEFLENFGELDAGEEDSHNIRETSSNEPVSEEKETTILYNHIKL